MSNEQLIPQNRTREEIEQVIHKQIAKDRGMKNQPYSTLNNFIQYSIGDSIQNFVDFDEKGNQTLKNGIVRYGYGVTGKPLKGKESAEIVFLNAFSQEEIDKQMEEIIYKPIVKIKTTEINGTPKEASYSLLLKKVELYFVESLYDSFSGGVIENKTIVMKDTELAKAFNVSRNYINQNMNKVIIALSQMQIRSYTPGKQIMSARQKGEAIPGLRLVNLIQDASHENGETRITPNEKFANYIGLCSPLQIPFEIYTIKDSLTYDIALYFYGLVRQKKENLFPIKVETIYNTIKQIPRYEYVTKRNYQREIYQPIERTFDLLREMQLIDINYENTNFINGKGAYDFKKWLDTTLIVKIIKEPDYEGLRQTREHYKQLERTNKEKAIKKAIEKKIISDNKDKIEKAVNETYQQMTF